VDEDPDARDEAAASASPKLLDRSVSPEAIRGRVAAIWTQLGATIGPCPRRYADGVSPTISRNIRLKVPRLVKPTSRQMSVTLRSVSRNRNIERSTRRRCR
jgi:hypothetical protein